MIIPSVSKPVSPSLDHAPLASACGMRRGAGAGKGAASALPRDASLGTTAKSLHTPSETPIARAVKAYRVLRYEATSQARHYLMIQAKKVSPESYPGDIFRTADCRYVSYGNVGVMYSAQHEAAHYSGLVTCGSVWACPLCAARIQERRRAEIQQAIDWAQAAGYTCFLVTFTFPHKSWNSLDDLLTKQSEAFRRLRNSRGYKRLRPDALIRSLEVTHGANGWHPHTHELWLYKDEHGPSRWDLTLLWKAACSKSGLLDTDNPSQDGAFNAHAVDVKNDIDGGDYLAKQDDSRSWGFAEEVSKANSKAGRAKGVHPHHFLVRQANGDFERYIEYVMAMKGKRQLFWTKGLKSAVGIDDVTDEVLADEDQEPAELLCTLSVDDWKLIRGNEARAELLDAAESGGVPAIKALISALK